MLQPSDRNHLFESLRPPADYTLDWAIGTTFTLDLLTLLTAPLAFTSFDWADEAGVLSRSPHSLLATMQQYADRISIFCQTGMIALPKQHHLLFSYLENCIVEVDAPRQQGLFHPKIWVLRFAAPDQPVCYRLLCLSRNLTFDRSWDTILLLDGLLTDNEIPDNQPLSAFVGSLPQLAHSKTVSEPTRQAIIRMQQELQRVEFELPPGFHTLKFHPIGIPSRGEFPLTEPIDRLLILSPFVADGGLQKLSQFGQDNVLISRPESLDAIPLETLDNFQLFQLSPYANPEEDDSEEGIEAEDAAEPAALVGLHAKLYVADAGPDARIWTGSANATEAAFALNIEFLVELIGAKERFGIDALLAPPKNNEINFRSMLEPFTPRPEPIDPNDDLEQLAASTQGAISRLKFHAIVSPLDGDLEQYRLVLQVLNPEQLQLSPDIAVKCYPLGHADLAVPITTPLASTFTFLPLSCEAVTSFLAFEIRSADGKQLLKSCVMNVPIEGIPENRRQQILRSLLKDKHQVLRLLMFLLADSRADAVELLAAMGLGSTLTLSAESNGHDSYAPQFPLFEALVKALSHNPTQLDRIHHLVNDLRQLPEDEQLLPDEFEQIWEPIYAVRQTLQP